MILIAIIVTIIIVFSTKSEDKQITPTTEDTGKKLQNVRILEDGTKLNTSEKVNKDRKVGEYEITNIRLTSRRFENRKKLKKANNELFAFLVYYKIIYIITN